MALDLRVAVNKTIVDLTREISKKRSELATLTKEVARYQKVQSVLNARLPPGRAKPNRKARRTLVDWNSVLKRLPRSFAVRNVTNLAKIKSRTYTHHILAKWIKQRKVKRLKLGKYQKL